MSVFDRVMISLVDIIQSFTYSVAFLLAVAIIFGPKERKNERL